MKSRVTVIIPNYNGFRFLESLFNSLLAQTYSNFQTIFIDDGSSDDSVAIAKTYIGKLPSFEIREYENEGIAANWNRAFDLVETEYFTLLHCDDAYEPDYLTAMIELMDKYPTAAIGHCAAAIINDTDEVIYSVVDAYKESRFFPTEIVSRSRRAEFNKLLQGDYVNCPSVIFRTAAVTKVGMFNPELRQTLDWEYWFRILNQGFDIVGVKRKLFRYRRHTENASVINSLSLKRYQEELQTFTWASQQSLAAPAGKLAGKAGIENIVLCESVVSIANGQSLVIQERLDFLENTLGTSLVKLSFLRLINLVGSVGAAFVLALFGRYVKFKMRS
jgi:glycosyltransferase involved in cell wall biosynthesis